jgi:hypothetical protein
MDRREVTACDPVIEDAPAHVTVKRGVVKRRTSRYSRMCWRDAGDGADRMVATRDWQKSAGAARATPVLRACRSTRFSMPMCIGTRCGLLKSQRRAARRRRIARDRLRR